LGTHTHFVDHTGQPHHLPCSKGGQQSNGFETVRFAVTIHPSIGRVFHRHPACKGVVICNDTLVIVLLHEAFALVAKLKLILKQDLLDLDVPKFNCYLPGNHLDDDKARVLFQNTLANQHFFSDLAALDAVVSTKGLRVAGVPIGDDAWVTKFVAEKVEAVILNVQVCKIDHVLADGIIHYHMLHFCQNTRPGLLAHNTPTPLISESLGSLESKLPSNSVMLESMCTKGTDGTHTYWTSGLRSFA